MQRISTPFFVLILLTSSCQDPVKIDPRTNRPVGTPAPTPNLPGMGTTPTSPTTPSTPLPPTAPTLQPPDKLTYTFSNLTGGQQGNADGPLAGARFNKPGPMAIDAQDRLYVIDRGNNAIRIIAPTGTVSTLRDAQGKPVIVGTDAAIAIGADGAMYVTESNSISLVTPQGAKSTLCGVRAIGFGAGGFQDGKGNQARFNGPSGVAFSGASELFVTDTKNYLIRQVTTDGTATTFAGVYNSGGTISEGTRTTAKFHSPYGVAVDGQKNVYVTEYFSSTVRKISADGKVTTLAGNGLQTYRDGTGMDAGFNLPTGIFSTKEGYLFVAEQNNAAIRLVTPAGKVTTLYKGQRSSDGLVGVVADSKGVVYFTEPGQHAIHKLTP